MSASGIVLSPVLLDSVYDVRLTNYFEASALVFLAYNILLSIDDEVEHIWNSRWTTAERRYFFSRYCGLFYLLFAFTVDLSPGLSAKFCRGYLWFWSLCGPIVFASIVNIIFLMRIYALYSAKMKVFIFLALLFVTELTSELWIVTGYAGLFSGCLGASKLHTIAIVAWVPRLCTSTIVFGMMLCTNTPTHQSV